MKERKDFLMAKLGLSNPFSKENVEIVKEAICSKTDLTFHISEKQAMIDLLMKFTITPQEIGKDISNGGQKFVTGFFIALFETINENVTSIDNIQTLKNLGITDLVIEEKDNKYIMHVKLTRPGLFIDKNGEFIDTVKSKWQTFADGYGKDIDIQLYESTSLINRMYNQAEYYFGEY